MKNQRPVNLDLTKFKFPPMAILSICHRITGVLIFLFLPLLLYMLHQSLFSAESFAKLQHLLAGGFMQFLMWVLVSAVLFHLVAGIRHLFMDLGYGESVSAGRKSAYIVFLIALVLVVLTGVWLW